MSRGRKKDEKPIPPTGPGSRVSALPDSIKRFIKPRTEKVVGLNLMWSTTSVKQLPKEIYENEEVLNFARTYDAENNRIKKVHIAKIRGRKSGSPVVRGLPETWLDYKR